MILSSDNTVRPIPRIRWSSYIGMEEANKWFWVLSDDTFMDRREIVIIVWCAHLNKEDYFAPIA